MFSDFFRVRLIVLAIALCYATVSKAGENSFFPLAPRLILSGGTGDNTDGHIDIMAPLLGSVNGLLYTDIEGQAGKGKSGFVSAGIGGRSAVNNDEMWGGYVFIDRSRSIDTQGGNDWTSVNPGIEFMTNRWDGRINGYIPVGNHKKVLGTYFADQLGMADAVRPTGHEQYSVLFDKIEEVGGGVDMDAGYTFRSLHRMRLHGGGYYFRTADTGDINGIEGGVEMPLNSYFTLQLDDSYDNVQKNTAMVSLRLTLGGMPKSYTPIVQDRILDPVHRHLGTLHTNAAIPSNTEIVSSNVMRLERDNIWFFDANNGTTFNAALGIDNCTYEHPCNGQSFNQTTINSINNINSHANFYFLPGTYTLPSAPMVSTLIPPGNRISLNAGQSMYGRMDGYRLPANVGNYPVFKGGLDPLGDNTLDSFALVNNNGSESMGIHILNASNVTMNNLQVGFQDEGQNYQIPLILDNAQNVTLQNSTLNGSVIGIEALNHSTATINNNTVRLVTSSTPMLEESIDAENNSVLNVNNNHFSITSSDSTINEISGIFSQSGATVNASANTFTLSNKNQAVGLQTQGGIINANNNTFNINSILVRGIVTNDQEGIIYAQNNTFNLATPLGFVGGVVWGISNAGSGMVIATHNIFNLSGDILTSVIGIVNTFPGNVVANNNIFTFSGTVIPNGNPCNSGNYAGSGNIFTGFTGTCN